MAIIDIKGVGKVKVNDKFLELSKEEQQATLREIRNKILAKDAKPTGKATVSGGARTVGQGLSLGFGDEIEAGLKTGFGFLGDYSKERDKIRGDIKDFKKAAPALSFGLELGGGLLTGGVGGARTLGAMLGKKGMQKLATQGVKGKAKMGAGLGATEGAIYGAGTGEDAASRIGGAVIGGGLGGALGGALPVAGGLLKGTGQRLGVVSGMTGKKGLEDIGDRKIIEALQQDKLTVQQIQDLVNAGKVNNKMLADFGGVATQRLLRGAGGASMEGANTMTKRLEKRAVESANEVADNLGGMLVNNRTALETVDDIIARQKSAGNSLYDSAFKTSSGSAVTVPITKTLTNMMKLPGFDRAVNQAQQLAKLEGKPFNFNPKSKSVRLQDLHYIKMGLDDVLDFAKTDKSLGIGGVTRNALLQRRKDFIKILDDSAPKANGKSTYETARNTYAGEFALRNSVEDGTKIFQTSKFPSAESIKRHVAKLTDSELESFRVGVVDSVKQKLFSRTDRANPYKAIFGNKELREKLRATFKNESQFKAFEKRMEEISNQFKTRERTGVFQGSRTAGMGEDINNLVDPPQITALSRLSRAQREGGMLGSGLELFSLGNRLLAGGYKQMGEPIGARVANDLTQLDPAKQSALFRRLKDKEAGEISRQNRLLRKSLVGSGSAGALSGNITQER